VPALGFVPPGEGPGLLVVGRDERRAQRISGVWVASLMAVLGVVVGLSAVGTPWLPLALRGRLLGSDGIHGPWWNNALTNTSRAPPSKLDKGQP